MRIGDLSKPAWTCVRFAAGVRELPSGSEFEHHNVRRVDMDGSRVRDEAGLFNSLAEAFLFPSYFGRNWDAVDECLRDLEWMPAAGYVLVVNHAAELWRDTPQVAGALIESWR